MPLAGQNIALIFEKPSLRTRVTFEVAIRQLAAGLSARFHGKPAGERETIPDLARNLSLWVDGIVARVFRHVDLEELAIFASVPVINALSDWEHPCQTLADILTLTEVWTDFEGKKVGLHRRLEQCVAVPMESLRHGRICFPRHLSRKATGPQKARRWSGPPNLMP